MKLLLFAFATAACSLCISAVQAEQQENVTVEQTTESPIADTALVGDESGHGKKVEMEHKGNPNGESQPHTIADFIVHPFIALKPRVAQTESGKQAGISSPAPSPWQFFPFNAGQGLGSSVSSLAGWLGNRIQLSGLVDTPVREAASTTSTTTSTTTTTARPEVVVRLRQPFSNKKRINTNMKKRPYPFNADYLDDNYDSSVYDDADDIYIIRGNHRIYQGNANDYDEDYGNYDHVDDGGEELAGEANHYNGGEYEERPMTQHNNRKKNSKPVMNNNKLTTNINNKNRRKSNKPNKHNPDDNVEVDQYDEYDDEKDFYYNKKQLPQRQQNLWNRGQRPATGVDNSWTKLTKINKKNQRPKTTLIIKRKGQPIFIAPEILKVTDVGATLKKRPSSKYPQAFLSVPYKRKGQPIQFITIPMSHLTVSRPTKSSTPAEGVPLQPLMLNLAQSVMDGSHGSGEASIKKPSITTEASIMDTSSTTSSRPTQVSALSNASVSTGTKPKPTPSRVLADHVAGDTDFTSDNMDGKKNSAESIEDDGDPSQYIVVGDDYGERKLRGNAYRRLVNYFKRNRLGRQFANALVNKTEEEIIPVQVIPAVQEPLKLEETFIDDKLEMTTKSSDVMNESLK